MGVGREGKVVWHENGVSNPSANYVYASTYPQRKKRKKATNKDIFTSMQF